MKNHFNKCIFIFALPLFFSFQEEPRKLVAETNHSTILFSVPISDGLTRITGKFNEYNIEIELPGDDITKAKMAAVIKVKSIDTGIPARDEDLQTKTFFESEKFPDITFTSDKILKTESGYLAQGKFQMHGITKSIELPFVITGKKNVDVIGFKCRTTISRTDYDLGTSFKHTTDDHFLGNEIGVEIDFWTRKPKIKK